MQNEKKDDHAGKPDEKTSIIIDKKQYFAPKPQMTGAELKALAGIVGDYILYKKVPGQGDDVKIKDDTLVQLKDGDHFYSVQSTLNPGGGHATA
jgi:hypothetical protein